MPTRLPATQRSRRLHVLGVPHTVPNQDYSVCAFTTKVLRFPDVIQPFGWDVVEYSNEGSASAARDHVVVLERTRLQTLSLRPSREAPHDIDVANAALQQAYQNALLERISARARSGDIVCHVYGPNMDVYRRLPECHHVEMSVGYTASPGLPFRIYESSAWMHWHHGKAGREDGSHYQWVIPSGFDPIEWPYREKPGDYALFLGRLTPRKGLNELVEIARRLPDLPIRAHGPGDSAIWSAMAPPNLRFFGPVFGAERRAVVQGARCMLMPTAFIEPFGFSGVEAQLCGVPLISSSFGAFQETVTEGVTGYRCHTLADWTEAVRLSAALDRRRISDLAAARYSLDVVGRQYDWAFRQLADLSRSGWYGEVSRKFAQPSVQRAATARVDGRIWLYIPYFGAFPNYFQLYLDSLGRNADRLSVFLMTDIDLSSYRLPENLIVVAMTFDELRGRIAQFVKRTFDLDGLPDDFLAAPYKLCDFKVLYPALFNDVGVEHGVAQGDFVGWGDCDVIYGRISEFIEEDDDIHVVGGYHGHFTALRNVDALRRLFLEVPNLVPHLLHAGSRLVDEMEFRKPLLDYLERSGTRMCDLHLHFCDVVPPCYSDLFRADNASRANSFFDVYHADKNISHLRYDQDGRLTVIYDDGSARPSVYCHLQKRTMTLGFPDSGRGFTITACEFRYIV